MRPRFTLGITTAGSVAAALISPDGEHAATTTRQALDGALRCVMDSLRAAGASLDDVRAIAVCTGPGSFTGLRIGVALAKSIAQARALPLYGVSSYDVVDFDAPERAPRAALTAGKRDFFYARVIDAPGATPRFARGSRAELDMELRGSAATLLSDVAPTEQALRVARIGSRMDVAGRAGDWRTVEIDYGQRPNAAANWEARQRPVQGGGCENAAKPRRR